ncbi:hypothetical protein [Gloeothece verrucosa]|uniref:Uncharacterized protein n=1 Tax=Gloeothece verrucosa (strain PCC 7822) TaxID=497965 RepID=E0UJJ2_GLOV7|nr:hypothetical protein [Gloeothece verrucosa]ADN12236.1 conserved hypothetical protein [Gloeothece verrucosa PCC 7822]
MGLKIVKNFEASFTLSQEAKTRLFELLQSADFLGQISQQLQGAKIEFTELLFQPVPYSQETPKGMPPELESYFNSEDYVIINVPPNFMFKAKVFNPSRLCAIYRKQK